MNPALRASAAHVFVEWLPSPELTDADAHHLSKVLRIRPTDVVTVSDGRGRWSRASLAGVRLALQGEIVDEGPPAPVAVAAAVPKGDRCEWMVQKLTEVGVTELVLVECERSVVRWSVDRAERQVERLRRVAREAAMQSRRVWLPEITAPVAFDAAASRPGAVLAEPGSGPLGADASLVVIGPEGGFSPAELGELPRVGLGPTVLRVETAALVAAVLLQGRHLSSHVA